MFRRNFIILPCTKVLVCLVYLAFFFAQLSFNVNTLNNNVHGSFYTSCFSNTTGQGTQNFVLHTEKSSTHAFRLNKRFYPEYFSNSVIDIACAPTVKLLSVYFSHYKSPLIQAVFEQGQHLRGPPSHIFA
ncbi:MAG: hypothetical protein LBE82_10900 [Chitinophagaceae bacterium]|jgi:hypothetical protein|nr:hypothetical protein [Chitinophagaceae bacterium]